MPSVGSSCLEWTGCCPTCVGGHGAVALSGHGLKAPSGHGLKALGGRLWYNVVAGKSGWRLRR